jgi:hypothetical protein
MMAWYHALERNASSRMNTAHFPFDRDIDQERGRLAAERARAQGKSALECALARIDATFSVEMRFNLHKRRVRAIIQAGVDNPEALRYRRVAKQVRPDIQIEAAVFIAERCYRMEVERRERIERTWGFCHEPRIRLMVLDELRLMLRWCRRFAPKEFMAWRDHLNAEDQ